MSDEDQVEFTDEDDAALGANEVDAFSQAVLYATDWTVETVVNQLTRGNIDMNPKFQRRDAWNVRAKGRFIESIILGLPIPQIVLAEVPQKRGKFIVIDGKQRLLALLQFTGNSDGPKNSFALTGLEARKDLEKATYEDLTNDPQHSDDLNAFNNHTIRTVVIRNYPGSNFLHLVFLRLNTGSVKLSPQELRQAIAPGPYSDFVDDAAEASMQVRLLLSRDTPDPRMRDVEILARFLAFRNRMNEYPGRMKEFLDQSAEFFNTNWVELNLKLTADVQSFSTAVDALAAILTPARIARKAESKSFNRAIFDVLVFYAAEEQIREAMLAHAEAVATAYDETLADEDFSEAVESDTAGIPTHP